MKIILADDEMFVRYGLKDMLQQIDREFKIWEVADGAELLGLLDKVKPDLIFADIKMPKMSGLEALKKGKERSGDAQWIILSGYSDFEYARTCIKYGVTEYLLKPLSLDEVKTAVDKASALRREKYKNHINEVRNDFVYSLDCYDPTENREAGKERFQAVVFYIDGNTGAYDRFKEELEKICYAGEDFDSVFFWNQRKQNEFILVMEAGEKDHTGKRLKYVADKIKKSFQESCITAYYMDDFAHKGGAVDEIIKIEKNICARLASGLGETNSLSALEKQVEQMGTEMFCFFHNIERFLIAIFQSEYLETINILQHIEKSEGAVDWEKNETCLTKYLSVYFPDYQWNKMDLIANMYKILALMGQKVRGEKQKNVIEEIKAYIDANFRLQLSVQNLANKFYITPNYLSSLFKKETGSNLIAYLNRRRIEEAAYLIKNTDMTIKEIGENVGYNSSRYFTKLFYEQYNKYPSEMRKKETS